MEEESGKDRVDRPKRSSLTTLQTGCALLWIALALAVTTVMIAALVAVRQLR